MKGEKRKQINLNLQNDIKDSFSISLLSKHDAIESLCRLKYNLMIIIEYGSGEISLDDETFKISGKEIFLAVKGQVIRKSYEGRISGYEMSFGDCFWERAPQSANDCKSVLYNDVTANPNIAINSGQLSSMLDIFNSLYAEYTSPGYINKLDTMAAYLKIIMIKAANLRDALLEGAFDTYENQLYRKFLSLLIKEFKTRKPVAAYAASLKLNARQLSDICRKCSGRGAKQLVDSQIIAEAKRLLQFSSMPIKEIAFTLSFSSAEQFSHFFKKNTSGSPEIYRLTYVNIGM